MGVMVLIASFADQLWQFYAIFFIGSFIGGGSLFAPMVANASRWFKTGVGLAIGVVSGGEALGQGLVPYFSGKAISIIGWSDTFLWMGISMLATLPLLLLLIRPPGKPPAEAGGGATQAASARRHPAVDQHRHYLDEHRGRPLLHHYVGAADPSGTLRSKLRYPAVGCRRHHSGYAYRRDLRPRRVRQAGRHDRRSPCVLGGLGLADGHLVAVFLEFQSLDSLLIFAVIYGFGYGGVMTTILVTMQVLTPAARRASATGIVTAFAFFGHAIGGYQGGLFFDLMGNYSWAFANAAIAGAFNLFIVAALYVVITRRPGTPKRSAAA